MSELLPQIARITRLLSKNEGVVDTAPTKRVVDRVVDKSSQSITFPLYDRIRPSTDRFVVHAGHDTIADFQNDRDTIDVTETLTTYAARKAYVDSRAMVVGGDTILTDDAANTITIVGLTDITSLYDDIV